MADNTSKTQRHITTIWQLNRHPHYELFFRFSEGFINASIAIMEKQLSGQHRDFFDSMASHFSFEHGIELFLKGAILLGDNSITVEALSAKAYGHTLGELYKKYHLIYIGDQYNLPNRVDEVIDWRLEINDTRGLAARYPFDKNGNLYGPKNLAIDLDLHVEIFRQVSGAIIKLEREIKKLRNIDTSKIEKFNYITEQ